MQIAFTTWQQMSLITAEYHLSVKPFAAVPALLNLPEIICGPATVSNVSCFSSMRSSSVNLMEGCLTTKSVKYAHQLAHIVMSEFSNLASEPVLTCCGCSYQNCCYKQGQPKSFSSWFWSHPGWQPGCNWLQWEFWRDWSQFWAQKWKNR